jgi:hypothetical protein
MLLYKTIDKARKPGTVNHHGHVTSNGRMFMTGKVKRSGCGMLHLTCSTLKLRSGAIKKATESHRGCVSKRVTLRRKSRSANHQTATQQLVSTNAER